MGSKTQTLEGNVLSWLVRVDLQFYFYIMFTFIFKGIIWEWFIL